MKTILLIGAGLLSACTVVVAPLVMADANGGAKSRDLIIKEKKRIQKLNHDQGQLARVRPQQPSRTLKVRVSTNQQRYKIGEPVVISVTPSQDAYITIVDHGTSGKIHTIFPNKFDTNRFVRANQTIRIPRPQDNYDYIASAPTGPEFIKVIASTNASRFIQDSSLSRGVVFDQVKKNAGALSRDLNIVLNKKQHRNNSVTYDHKIYIYK